MNPANSARRSPKKRFIATRPVKGGEAFFNIADRIGNMDVISIHKSVPGAKALTDDLTQRLNDGETPVLAPSIKGDLHE